LAGESREVAAAEVKKKKSAKKKVKKVAPRSLPPPKTWGEDFYADVDWRV
jgi:hypothetical protein